MKKYLILLPLFALSIPVWAQTQPVKIIFDVTSKDQKAHQSTMRHVKMMSEAHINHCQLLIVNRTLFIANCTLLIAKNV